MWIQANTIQIEALLNPDRGLLAASVVGSLRRSGSKDHLLNRADFLSSVARIIPCQQERRQLPSGFYHSVEWSEDAGDLNL